MMDAFRKRKIQRESRKSKKGGCSEWDRIVPTDTYCD
jgi:hypothetical protein